MHKITLSAGRLHEKAASMSMSCNVTRVQHQLVLFTFYLSLNSLRVAAASVSAAAPAATVAAPAY